MKTYIILFMAVSTSLAVASDNAGAFLEKSLSARAAGMGMGFTAVAHDSQAVYWNPAGLVENHHLDIGVQATDAYDANYYAVQSAFTLFDHHVGVHFLGVSADGGAYTVSTFDDTLQDTVYRSTGRNVGYEGHALHLGMGKQLTSSLAIGFTAKAVQETLAGYKATGFGLDFGSRFYPNQRWKIGAVVQNLIQPSMSWNTPSKNADTIPRHYKIGVSYTPLPNQLYLSADFNLKKNRQSRLNLGAEYWIRDLLALRGGFEDSTLTLGTGLRHGGLRFDVAWTKPTLGFLDDVYRFSVGADFGTSKH